MEKIALSIKEAAAMLGVSRITMYEWAKEPDFPAVRRGRRVFIPLDQFKEWVGNLPRYGGNT